MIQSKDLIFANMKSSENIGKCQKGAKMQPRGVEPLPQPWKG